MSEETTIFDIMRVISLWSAPVILFVGLVLLFLNNNTFSRLEDKLGKEVGGLRKRIFPKIETNIFSLQNWLLTNRRVVAIFFIFSALIFIFLLRKEY